ncbi:hypothetical protein Tco_0194067 [Tanacetum coccineum]
MANLKFVDTHNMVAFLAKLAESKRFEQIANFLNSHTIKYALTINPTIYTSCIEQFWATIKAKTINGEVQLQALVDGKKIIITESIVRRDLQLEDAEGVDCLPNATIFEQLTLMGYEKISQKLTFYKAFFSPQWKFLIHIILQCLSSRTTAWNEFSSIMASAIIYLATNQKFNFSKYIFESMVKNLDNAGKFLMYPRFVQVFVNQKLEGMPTHKRIYIAPSHTKKIFGNMRRVGKGFSGRETPLFQITVVQDQAKIVDEAVNEEMDDSLVRVATTATSLDAEQDRGNTLRSGEDSLKLNELMELCTNLQQRALDLETTKTTQATEIASLKRRVKKLERRNKLRTHRLKRLYRVGSSRRTDEDMFDVNDLDSDEVTVESVDIFYTTEEIRSMVEEVIVVTIPISAATTTTTTTDVEMTLAQALAELKSAKPKADKVMVQDKGKGKMVKPELVKKVSKKELLRLDEELAFNLQAEEEEEERLAREKAQQVKEANIAWDDVQAKIDADYQLAKRAEEKRNRPPTRAQQRSIITELVEESSKKVETEQEENLKKAGAEIAQESSLKRPGEELEQESSKKQKLEEDKESEELKQCLKIILDDGDDVTIDATPLSTKSLTIMYLTFGKMLKNFDREDLEVLWSIVKARFKKTEPVNYMDNFLLLNLKTMFEHHVEDNNMLFYLLVEKIYPLTNHTLHQMFNDVKLQVDYECEMAFELLRLVKKQLKEGYVPE